MRDMGVKMDRNMGSTKDLVLFGRLGRPSCSSSIDFATLYSCSAHHFNLLDMKQELLGEEPSSIGTNKSFDVMSMIFFFFNFKSDFESSQDFLHKLQ